MKKVILLFLSAFTFLLTFSQNGYNPPDNVRQGFQRQYPQSQATQWSHEGGNWNVNFEDRDHGNGESTAHFDGAGRHIDTHIPYDNHDVPGPVMDRMRNHYPGSDDYAFTRIERDDDRGVFQVHFRHRKRYRTIYMDERGREREYHDRH